MSDISRLKELLDPNAPEFMSYAEIKEALALVDKLVEAIAAAEQRGWARARDEAAQVCYQREQEIQAAFAGSALTEKEAGASLSFVGAYRDAIRAMSYEPGAVTK